MSAISKYSKIIDLDRSYLNWQHRERPGFGMEGRIQRILNDRASRANLHLEMLLQIGTYFKGNGIEAGSYDDEFCYFHGSSMTIYNSALKCFDRSKPILLASPYFSLMHTNIGRLGLKTEIYDTSDNGYKIDPQQLRAMIEKMGGKDKIGAVVINYPCNPLMLEYHEQELRDIAQVIKDTGVRLIVDELYSNLGPKLHLSLAGVKMADGSTIYDQTLTIDSTSKKFGNPQQLKTAFACSGDTEWMRATKRYITGQDRATSEEREIEDGMSFVDSLKTNDLAKRRSYMNLARSSFTKEMSFANEEAGDEIFRFAAPVTTGYYVTFGLDRRLMNSVGASQSSDVVERLRLEAGVSTTPIDDMGVKGTFVRANITYIADASEALARTKTYVTGLLGR